MLVDTKDIVTMTEANKNFSEVARRTDHDGKTVIFKNNKPKYIVISITEGNYIDLTDDERFEIVAKRIMRRHKAAFLELAK